MSCHDIGRGMSSVVEVVLAKLDKQEISVETARDLLYACRKGVHWCDGNEIEAMIQMHHMRCGYCLEKKSEGDRVYNLYDTSYSFQSENQANFREIDEMIADYCLCEDCFKKLLDKIAPGVGEEQCKYIQEKCDEEEWHYKDCRSPWEKD